LTTLLAAALLGGAGRSLAADVSTSAPAAVSTGPAVSVSTAAPISLSTQAASASVSSFPLEVLSTGAATTTKEQTEQKLAADSLQALRDLAAFYSAKRRSPFMRLVPDDFTGDLGTFEDALSSDFRSYRTISLVVRPDNVVVRGQRATVQFTYDLTIVTDQGVNTLFSGHATYVFQQEGRKVLLYQMSNNPIFGTSLSSIENPVAKSQGTPTQTPPVPGTPSTPVPAAAATPPCSATTLHGTGTINAGTNGYRFSTQSNATPGQSDVYANPNSLVVNPGGGIVDVGPCNLTTFTMAPASINGSSAVAVNGDCYAIKTLLGNYAAILLTSVVSPGDISFVNFNYEYQPSGARCF
jgi:hypothetical protein